MATETGISEVLLPKNGESEGAAVKLKKHELEELCHETEQGDQVEIKKSAVMSGNHGTLEDASILAPLSDQVVSNEADQNGKVHEVLKNSEDSKSGELKSEVSIDRDIDQVVMDRNESIDEGSGALGHKVEAPETSVEKSGDVGLSEEQGRVSEVFLAKEDTDRDEISLDTVKDEVKDTNNVESEEGPSEEEEIVKTEVSENERVDLPAVRLLVEQAEVVNGKKADVSDMESHEYKVNREVLRELQTAGGEKAVEEDEFSIPNFEETKAVISEEKALKSRDEDDIHVDEHVEIEHSILREVTPPEPESILDNQKEDEIPNEEVAIEKTAKDEVMEELRRFGAHDAEKLAEEVNEESKESGPIKSSVEDNEVEDESHGHNTIPTREFILEETNNDSSDSSKQYIPSKTIHEKAIEELDTNTIIPYDIKKDVESSVSPLSAKQEDPKEVSAEEKKAEMPWDEAPKSETDVKTDDQTIKSEEEIMEKVKFPTAADSTQQELSENTQDKAAEIIERDSVSQLKDRDQYEISVEEKKVEISEGETLKKSEDEVQNDEQTGIIDKMFNFFSKTKDEETTRVEEVNEEATLAVADSAQEESGKSTEEEEKSKEESASQLKDRDQHEVSAEEKKVEIFMDEALKSEGKVQKDELLVKVEKEIVEKVTLSTTNSTQEEPSVSTQDKAYDEDSSHEESASLLKERDHAEVSVEKKISEDEVQKSDDKVLIDEQSVKVDQEVIKEVTCSRDDDKSHEESAAEIIMKESENEPKDQDPNEVLGDEKKIEVYMDEAPKSEGEVQNNEQATRFDEESEVTLSTTDSTQEETSKSRQAEEHDKENSKDESIAEIIEEESANKLKEEQDQTEVLVEERKFEISNEETVKSERDVVNKDQAIKVEKETIEEVPLSTNSTTQEDLSDDKQDKAQYEEKLKESTEDIDEESANKLKGEDRAEVSVEEKKDDISIDEAPKSEGEVQSNKQTDLMNKIFGYFSKKESNELITRVEEEINEEVTVSTTDSTQLKATEIIEEESANESKDQDPTEVLVKDDRVEISKGEAPEPEGEVQSTEKTGLMNKMFGYFSKQESEEVTVSTPEFQQEIKEESKTEIVNEEAGEKLKDREIKAEICKEEIVTLETKATESSPSDMYIEGEIKEDILNVEATEMPKDQETKAETSNEEVTRVIETPEVIQNSVEASSENREESPHEEANLQGQIEEPVELPKDVNDNPDKIEGMLEETNTESSEKVNRDIQQLKEFSDTGKPENTDQRTDLEKEITKVETSEASESVQHKNAEDALQTLVFARSDETIEEIPLSTISTTQEETSNDKQDKGHDEEKVHEESTAHVIDEESVDKLKGEDSIEVSAEEKKVEISKDEALKSEGEAQSKEQPGLMNKMFGYFSKIESDEPNTKVVEEINEEVTVFTNDSTQDKATEIIEEESASKLKDQDPTDVLVKEDEVEISKDEAPNSEGEVQKTEHTGLMNKMFSYFTKKEGEEVTAPTPEFQQELTPRDYTKLEKEIKEEIETDIVNKEATEKSKDQETEAETSNEEVAQVFEAPKAIERSVHTSSEKQEESLKEDAEPQSRVEDPIQSIAEDTSSVESPKENKTESSEIVVRDIQNIQVSSETEKSENVDHKPDLEKQVTEVERSEASESAQCKNTEDALEILVVAPSEVQHSKGGTLVNEDDETDFTDKDSRQATKEEPESDENLETEPSSGTTDTEKVDESVSYETNKDFESSIYPAEILIAEKKIEDTLSTETKEKEATKIDEPGEELEELPQTETTVENLEETVETEKKEEKTREIDEVNDSENKAAEIIEEKDLTEVSLDENKVEISKDESPESDREVQTSEQTGLIDKMFGFFSKKESEEVTVSTPELQREIKEESETETVNEEATEKPKDREREAESSNEEKLDESPQVESEPQVLVNVDRNTDLEKEVVQELETDIFESRVGFSLEKQDKKDQDILLTEVAETTRGGHNITEQASREIDFAEDTKEFQAIAVPSSSSVQDENVEKSSKELEKEECTPNPESFLEDEVAEEETPEGKTSLTEAKSDYDVVVEERDLETDLSGEISSVKEAEPESEEKLECSDIAHEDKSLDSSVGDVEVHASAEISGEETSSKEVKMVIEEQPGIESFEAVNEEKDSPSVVSTGLLSDSDAAEPASEETSSTETCLKVENPEDEEKIKGVDIGSLSDIVSKEVEPIDGEEVKSHEEKSDSVTTETYLSEADKDHDDIKISDSAPVDTNEQPDSFSGEATLLKEEKSTDKDPIKTHDTGPQSETVFLTETSSKDLELKEPDPDATSEEIASSYDSSSLEIPGEEEDPIKSNDMITEVKFDSDDRVKTSDIAPVESDVQHVNEGASSRVAKVESELASEDVIVARDRDIETQSNSALDEVGSKEDDKAIARFSEMRLDDSSEELGPSKELLMKLSKQEGGSEVVSNVNEEVEELNKQPEIISRDTIPIEVHEGSVEEGVESVKIEESIKREEVFEERNSSHSEINETNPNELISDSSIKEYVAETNEESITIVTEPKEENESIVLEERSFGFAPETGRKNSAEEVKLASDTKVTDVICPILAVELRETSEAKEEANESSQQIPNDEISHDKPRDMEPERDEATEGSHGVGKDEAVTDRDLHVGVATEPIQVSLEEESEFEITSTVQKVEEETETEILDEIKKDSLAEKTKAKEEPEESDITEVEIIEKSGSRSLHLEKEEDGFASTIKEVLQEAGSEDKDVAKSSHVVDEVVTDRDIPLGISTEPIPYSPSTRVTEDSDSEILEDKKTKDSLAEETKATEVHEGSVEEGIESAKIEESIKSEEAFEEKNCNQVLAEVKEINSNDRTPDSPVEEYVAKKNEESVTVVAELKEENESVVLEERSFGFAPETERKNIIEGVNLASDTELDEAAEGSHGVGKDEVVTDRHLPVGVSTEPIRDLPEEDSKSENASTVRIVEEEKKGKDETKKETEILDDEKMRDSLATETVKETRAKEEPEESDVTEVEIIENSSSRSLPLEEQEAGISTTIKEFKVSKEAGSEAKDALETVTGPDSESAHVVLDEVVTDRDFHVGISTEPLVTKVSDSEIHEDKKIKDSLADEAKAKQEPEEQDVGVTTTTIKQVSAKDFKAESEVKVSDEAVLEENDALKPVCEFGCETKGTSSGEKGLAMSTKEVPGNEVLSIAEKEEKNEAKKLDISEGPKVIREVETEKAHSPTEKNKAAEMREERDFVSNKSGSPEPKTSIEDVQFIEDHLKIATTDGKGELSTENRQVKAIGTEAPTDLEETSQRDSKPELVSLSGLVESPKEDAEHKKSEHSTDQGTEEPKKKEGKNENENDDHDDEEEEEEDEEDHDASTSVQFSKDGDAKASKKKSHGLFSGVGSKVKHSISKVKKAITGKSSSNTKEAAAK